MRVPLRIVMALGLLAAPALAETPEDLPAQVAGVIGSGDQLSLQLKPAAGSAERTIRVGEAFPDGWVLSSLSDTLATLSRNGTVRTIGLNPTGAVAPPSGPVAPSTVRVVGGVELPPEVLAALALTDEQVIARMNPGNRQNYPTRVLPGLTLAESQRYELMTGRLDAMTPALLKMAQANAAAAKAQGVDAAAALDGVGDRIFGSDYAELRAKQAAYNTAQATSQYQAALAAGIGPTIVPFSTPRPASIAPYADAMTIVAEGQNFNLFMPTARSAQPASGVGGSPPIIPTLTESDLVGLTLNSAPLDAATKAELLASNRQEIAYAVNPPNRPAGAVLYGPFGLVAP